MILTIESAVWANAAKTAIRANVVSDTGVKSQFTVIENDPDETARTIWADCVAGKFPAPATSGGVIGDYVPGSEPVIDPATFAQFRVPLVPPPIPPEVIDGGEPAPTLMPVTLPEYAAARRYAVETGGIVISGVAVATDRASQAMLAGAFAFANQNPEATIQYKAASGWVSLTHDQVVAIANAVGAHVQACFAAEHAVDAAIAAGTITTRSEIDEWEWPSGA